MTCSALDQCHVAGTCNPANGQCSNPNAADGTACDDNPVCNGHETCKSGVCTAGTPLNCDDGKSCTADSCDAVKGCQNTPHNDACNDNNLCTTDTCNPSAANADATIINSG